MKVASVFKPAIARVIKWKAGVGGGSLQNGVSNVLSVPPSDPWPPLINTIMPFFASSSLQLRVWHAVFQCVNGVHSANGLPR